MIFLMSSTVLTPGNDCNMQGRLLSANIPNSELSWVCHKTTTKGGEREFNGQCNDDIDLTVSEYQFETIA
jgi:hypothetical protein